MLQKLLVSRRLLPCAKRKAVRRSDRFVKYALVHALPTALKQQASKNKGRRGCVAYYYYCCNAAGRSPQCVRIKRTRYGRIRQLIKFATCRRPKCSSCILYGRMAGDKETVEDQVSGK